jgi:hypothetical protein
MPQSLGNGQAVVNTKNPFMIASKSESRVFNTKVCPVYVYGERNLAPKRYAWKATSEEILAEIKRARERLSEIIKRT